MKYLWSKKLLEVFDISLNDLMKTNTLFGRKVVVFSDDFRQIFSVAQSEKKVNFI